MNEKEVMATFVAEVSRAGSQRAFAEAHGMSAEYVRLVITKQRPIGDRILAALGIEKSTTTTYRLRRKK